jgi:hypothetical protein
MGQRSRILTYFLSFHVVVVRIDMVGWVVWGLAKGLFHVTNVKAEA